jgi:hypothetical protein
MASATLITQVPNLPVNVVESYFQRLQGRVLKPRNQNGFIERLNYNAL